MNSKFFIFPFLDYVLGFEYKIVYLTLETIDTLFI